MDTSFNNQQGIWKIKNYNWEKWRYHNTKGQLFTFYTFNFIGYEREGRRKGLLTPPLSDNCPLDYCSLDNCFKQGNNFALLAPPLVWFTMDLQTGHLADRYHAQIILLLLCTMKLFLYFFFWISFSKKLFFFAFWCKKIRRHLVKVGLWQVVFCKV